jgi:hypothetical protein
MARQGGDSSKLIQLVYNKRRHPFPQGLPENDYLLDKWRLSFVEALSCGAMNMAFHAHRDPRPSKARDRILELGPAKVLLDAVESSPIYRVRLTN